MGIKVSMKDIPDSQDFSLIPLGKYPARMKVDAYQTDQQKNFMLDGNGEKTYWQTANGDPKWNLRIEILEGPHAGREILDNLNFSSGGLKRVKVLYVRGGFGDATDEVELEPEDFDGTYWLVDVDKHEVAQRNGTVLEAKRAFTAACPCENCKANNGKMVMMNARIGFAGFEPMPAAQAAKYNGAATGGVCGACAKADHSHKQGANSCACPNTDHPPF
jgi:hypothetical protein